MPGLFPVTNELPMLLNWIFRYGGLAIQFVILSVLARHLDTADYGRYLLVLSVVTPLNGLLALGVSESFVREAPVLLHDGDSSEVRKLVGATVTVALGMAAFTAVSAAVVLWFLPIGHTTTVVIGFIVAMLIATGLTFNGAHMLLGAGFEVLGSFFFYPAVNLSILLSSVPYVVLTEAPTFAGIALVNSSAALVVAAAANLAVLWRMRPSRPDGASMTHLVRLGIRLASIRTLRQGGGWIPTFVAGVTLGPTQAGYLGLASRTALLVAVPTQTLRFAARPAIVRAYARGDYQEIRAICGRPAGLAFTIALIAVLVSSFAGDWAIGLAFGKDMVPAAPLMTVVLLGVALDAFGGPVDEVLKMTGHEKLALKILCVCIAGEAIALVVTSHFGVVAMAWAVNGYFAALSATMIIAAHQKLGIWLHPMMPHFPTGKLRKAMRRAF
ncbi:hypothetical protein B1R94_04950 [Mycolicibacterium litorale]|nr:hypothetical protein B1R94_04950 [Mycolicibacterium litorale]